MLKQFGAYKIKEKIATGGMATIYAGEHSQLKSKVAIKILPLSLSENETYIARFEREAKTTSRLNHENIVKIIDFGKQDDIYFIVMEHVEGFDLRNLLDDVPQFPLEVALAILEETCFGLREAHAADVLHRDIKPGNILLSKTGGVKLVDFGLALRMSDYERMTRITAGETSLGTPAYMSPEQALTKDLDQRSDIYSLGATAYELLTGQRPYGSSSPSELREKIVSAPPPSPRAETLLVSPELDAIVRKMMAKDPESRYSNVDELLAALESVMDSLDREGHLVQHRRRLLQEFAAEPTMFVKEQRQRKIQAHTRRAHELMATGPGSYDRARKQFSLVLFLDPENEEALAGIKKIREEIGDDMTVGVEDVFPSDPGGGDGGTAGAGTGDRPKKRPGWLFPAAIGAVLLLIVLLWTTLRGQDGQLTVVSDPQGATVAVRKSGEMGYRSTGMTTPCTIDLESGAWDVRLHLKGYEITDLQHEIESGEEMQLDVKLALPRGWVIFTGDTPESALWLRGPGMSEWSKSNMAPPCTLHVAQGAWEFILEAEEMASETLQVAVNPGDVVFRTVALRPLAESVGWISVRSRPSDANIEFRRSGEADFREVEEATPCSLGLEPGGWELRLTKPCYKPSLINVVLAAGETVTEDVRLQSVGHGTVKIILSPIFADIYINGKRVAREKRVWEGTLSSCGTHDLEVRHHKLGSRKINDIALRPGETISIDTLFSSHRGG